MNLSKKSKIVIFLLLGAIATAFIGYKIIYKPHPSIETQEIVFKDTAEAFKTTITTNQEKWLNAIVQLNGKITDKDSKGITINSTIYCQLKYIPDLKDLQIRDNLTIKGRFIGYDDLLEEIKLDKCILIDR